jgi:hypothetical protein
MGLEDLFYGSKTIRDYLKLFSEQQWNRLCKATMMLGVQYLTNLTNNDIRKLSVKDIEDIVGKNACNHKTHVPYSRFIALASDCW